MKVLIAANSSDNFNGAMEFLKGNTWSSDTVFRLVHVVEPSDVTDLWLSMSGATRFREILSERQVHAESQLADTKSRCEKCLSEGAQLETSVVVGRLDETVGRIAQEWQADLAILGLPESTLISRYTEGASFARVVETAPCPVTFARVQKKEAS